MKKYILHTAICLLTFCTFGFLNSYCQNSLITDGTLRIQRTFQKETQLPSEKAWQPIQYTEPDVDKKTGAIGYSIPLCQLTCGSLSLPISLQYHGNGIKADDDACTVGLGWNLSAGGYITRTICGRPDEQNFAGVKKASTVINSQDLSYVKDVLHRQKDANYDRYNYSFCGYSGSFIISSGGAITQLPATDLRIEAYGSMSAGFDSFKITTPDGNIYWFNEQEHTNYIYHSTTLETRVGYNTPDYTAVTGWYLTQITSPQQNDTIYFKYQPRTITRQRIQDRLNNLSTYMIGIETITSSTPPNQLRDESVITHPDKCLPLSIRCRGTRVNFTNSQFLNTPYYTITQIKLYSDSIGNDANNEVKRISLAYSQTGDNRSLLQSCEMHSKNTLVDKRTFTYYTGVANDHTDLFGYKNHNTQAPALSSSVLDTDGLLCANKQHYFASAVGYMLKTVKDANGALATIEYEPSQCRSGNRDIHVGIRVKKITSSENLTNRNIVRKFEYANAASTIDFAWVTHDAFITPGGMLGGPTLSTPKYTCGATFTSSSRIPGAQVENCEIYYGRVAEKVIGTGLPDTLCTVYEYDLSDIQHPFISNGCQSVLPNLDNRADAERYLGTKIISNRSYEEEMRIFSPHHITGHFRENCREKAPLKRKILMRKTHDGYSPEYEEENFYSYVESSVLDVGFHVELITRNYNCEAAGSVQTVEQDDYLSDFNFMETTLQSARLFKDSTVIRRYYPDGNVRMTSIGYYYNSRSSGRLPFLSSAVLPPIVPIRLGLMGFSGDSIRLSNMGMLQAIKVKCGNSTFDRYFCYADNVESATYNSIKSKGMRTLPVMEKIVVDGKDSLLTCYSYKSFGSSHNIQLSEQRILHGDAEVASQQFINYDQWGNVLATSVNHGMVTTYRWDHEHGLPTLFCDGGLAPQQVSDRMVYLCDSLQTTTCRYIPLIGCSSIKTPNGRVTNFTYEGNRLKTIENSGDILKSYTYILNADDTAHSTMVKDSTCTGTAHDLVTQTFYDGFGYPVNVRVKGAGANNNDLVSFNQYDALHRLIAEWLPISLGNSTNRLTVNSISSTARAIYSDERPYRTRTYEPVPGEQLSADIPEGTAFEEHPVTYAHLCTNNSVSALKCLRFVMCDNDGVKTDGYYDNGELDVLQCTDNDGNDSYVFTDYRGNKILERSVYSSTSFAETYYVYDALGNLRYVLPPGISHSTMSSIRYISTNAVLKNYAYYYKYDDQLRLVEKKLPGNDPIYFVNDLTGATLLTQDGNLRQSGKWRLTLPDKYGREVLDGIVSCTASEQNRIKNTWIHANKPDFSSIQNTLCQTGYTANINVSSSKLLNATYYDTYGCRDMNAFSTLWTRIQELNSNTTTGELELAEPKAKGLKTAMLSAVGDDGLIASIVQYDNLDRPSMVITSNVMGGYDITKNEYTLDGRPTVITHRHATQLSTPSNSAICETITYGYDEAGRQDSIKHRYSNAGTVVLRENTYDFAGRLATTRVNDKDSLQTAYEYNIRGWLKTLNNPLFYESLKYDEVQNESTPQYGGNISFMNWKINTGADSDPMHGFRFKYDNLSRLKSAHYFRDDVSKTWYQTIYTYNKMGNIASLIRRCTTNNSTTKLPDNLKYTYSGNRLTRVEDSATGVTNVDYQQFYDGASETTEYLYDQNGNMTVDKNSGITRVGYDANNQPDSVTFSTGESIRYYYDGMGNRLGTDEYTAFMPVYLQGAANTLINDEDREVLRRRYCGNFVYEDGILQRVLVEGGFITFSNGAPQYHFYIKDHLGSNRVVTDANGNIEEYNHYYPYGALMNISSASTQPYKYNGKELNRLNRLLWYDQSARQYNPILGRFMSMDPLCEKYYSISPYAYCKGNPICRIDPDGKDDYFNTEGKHYLHTDNNTDLIHIVSNKVGKSLKNGNLSPNEVSSLTSFSLNVAKTCQKIYKEGYQQKDGSIVEVGNVVMNGGQVKEKSSSTSHEIIFNLTDSEVKDAEAFIHYHPMKFNSYEGAGFSLATEPSGVDKDTFKHFETNIIVGWLDKRNIQSVNTISSVNRFEPYNPGIAIYHRDENVASPVKISLNALNKIVEHFE